MFRRVIEGEAFCKCQSKCAAHWRSFVKQNVELEMIVLQVIMPTSRWLSLSDMVWLWPLVWFLIPLTQSVVAWWWHLVSCNICLFFVCLSNWTHVLISGQAVKYNGSIDCTMQIIKNEGFMSLMKGAGANILRGVAGAGVLAGFDEFQKVYISYRYK